MLNVNAAPAEKLIINYLFTMMNIQNILLKRG